MADGDPTDYKIGYGRPPEGRRFKPGQSGNPTGRPKGARNLSTLLEEEMGRVVTVTIGGAQTKISKGRLAVRQQVEKAAKGDSRAFMAIAKLASVGQMRSDGAADTAKAPSELSADTYKEALEAFLQSYLRKDPA